MMPQLIVRLFPELSGKYLQIIKTFVQIILNKYVNLVLRCKTWRLLQFKFIIMNMYTIY